MHISLSFYYKLLLYILKSHYFTKNKFNYSLMETNHEPFHFIQIISFHESIFVENFPFIRKFIYFFLMLNITKRARHLVFFLM